MIIRLEADGQACLDSGSESKVSFDSSYALPEQPYRRTHPVLRNIDTGDASSVSTASDDNITRSNDFPTKSNEKRRRVFPSPFGTTETDSEAGEAGWSSWSNINKRWLALWLCLTLILCVLVAVGVWIVARPSGPRHEIFIPDTPPQSPQNIINYPQQAINVYSYRYEYFGCAYSKGKINGTRPLLLVPYGTQAEHKLVITGGAVGMLTLASSPDPATREVLYDIDMRGDEDSLAKVTIDSSTNGSLPFTNLDIDTPPGTMGRDSCVFYEITMYVPRGLKKLQINIYSPVRVQFSPQGHIELDSLAIRLLHKHKEIEIASHESVHAGDLTLDIQAGRIIGAISIVNSARIVNRDYSGQIRLHVIPDASPNLADPSPAYFSTISKGMASIAYLRNLAYRKRGIVSHHTSEESPGASLDYMFSEFDGLVLADAKHNLLDGSWHLETNGTTLEEYGSTWTHFSGNWSRPDRLYIQATDKKDRPD